MKVPRFKRQAFAVFLLCVFAASCARSNSSRWADVLVKARDEGRPIPVLSAQYPEMDAETAYRIQKTYVARRLTRERIAGFKAGLTSEASQKKFGMTAPLAGVLCDSGRKQAGSAIDNLMFGKLMIETEIGFLLGKAIAEPIDDVGQLRNSIQAVMPVIELPDLGFADMKKLRGVDIIAANVTASQFIVGRAQEAADFDLNSVVVSLSLDGQNVNSGKGSDALGDQWEAAVWLVNAVVEQGYSIERGHILITGALGEMVPGKPGRYVADYGSFGQIAFEVK